MRFEMEERGEIPEESRARILSRTRYLFKAGRLNFSRWSVGFVKIGRRKIVEISLSLYVYPDFEQEVLCPEGAKRDTERGIPVKIDNSIFRA